jgi:hypothetical protein
MNCPYIWAFLLARGVLELSSGWRLIVCFSTTWFSTTRSCGCWPLSTQCGDSFWSAALNRFVDLNNRQGKRCYKYWLSRPMTIRLIARALVIVEILPVTGLFL